MDDGPHGDNWYVLSGVWIVARKGEKIGENLALMHLLKPFNPNFKATKITC